MSEFPLEDAEQTYRIDLAIGSLAGDFQGGVELG